MNVYTGKGDSGNTDLFLGGRFPKDNLIIDCLGNLDELNSFLGLLKASIKTSSLKRVINDLQNDIYIISSEIATKSKNLNKLQVRFSKKRLIWLEENIDDLAAKARFKNCCFYITGENVASSVADVCRTVCRRTERKLVSLNRREKIRNSAILPFINRLSSLLFVLVRLLEKEHKIF